jgi:hypothetical protein
MGVADGTGWPLQRRGIVPQNAAGTMNTLQTHLARFEPASEGQKTLHADADREFTRIVELRRTRLPQARSGTDSWNVRLPG